MIKVYQTRLMTISIKEEPHHPSVPQLEHLMCSPYSPSPALEETCRYVMMSFFEIEKEEWTHIKCDGSPLHSLAARSDIHSSLKNREDTHDIIEYGRQKKKEALSILFRRPYLPEMSSSTFPLFQLF